MTAFAVYRFPCGAFRIEEESGYIVSLTLVSSQSPDCGTPSPLTDKTAAQMEEYFHGVRKSFDVPYLLRGTVFQKEVWKALCQIPYGQTRSYRDIAESLGRPRACRAVGMANHRNPLTPCRQIFVHKIDLDLLAQVGYTGPTIRERGVSPMKILFRVAKVTAIILVVCIVIGILSVWAINQRVVSVGGERLLTVQEAEMLEDVDCVLVLGCGVKTDGTPSLMLQDRLDRSIQLYQQGVAPKLLMSGDHGRQNYNEVGTMKQYAIDAGVPSSDVFMDHAGFSTYESMYRAKEIFHANKIVIVSQEYHLYRAIYVAQALGLDAYGVAADGQEYAGQWGRDVREILARVKDFFTAIWKPEPTYLGEAVPVSGNGDVTNDDGGA